MEDFRLYCRYFWVDVRIRRIEDRWIASADTPDGPTIGTGMTRDEALYAALEDFCDVREELLESVAS